MLIDERFAWVGFQYALRFREDNRNVPSSANKIKLGELLIDAGIITSGDLTEAIQVSRRLGVPIGQALLVSRCVTDSVLEAALEAQPLVKDGTISRSAAVDALRKSVEAGSPLRDMLNLQDGAGNEDHHQTSKRLAELLLDSDIVNQDQVDQALMTSFSSGMPLGSALVLEGVLSPSLFPSILRIQRNIREGKVGREEGISELRSTFLHWIKAEESLARDTEMEDSAEIYSQEEIDEAIHSFVAPEYAHQQPPEYSHQQMLPPPPPPPPPPSIPITIPPPPPPHVPALAQEQAPVAPPVPTAPREPVIIQQPTRSQHDQPRLFDLLKEAGSLDQSELQDAFNKVLEDPIASGKLFVLLGLTDEKVVKTALRKHSLIEKHEISDHEAVDAIREYEAKNDSEATGELRAKRQYSKEWRKSTATKVLGGIAVGAAVAGISSLFKKPKR